MRMIERQLLAALTNNVKLRQVRRVFVVLVAVLTVAGLTAASAVGGAPVIVEKQNQLTRHFANLPDCLEFGFTHTEDYQVTRTVTDFYDSETNLIREVLHIRFVGTATNDVTGKTIPVTGVRHLVFDFAAGTFTETGVLRHVTVPGEGIVLHESGRIVLPLEQGLEPLFVAGPHQLLEADVDAFCAALTS
jgi:hypothetical protein